MLALFICLASVLVPVFIYGPVFVAIFHFGTLVVLFWLFPVGVPAFRKSRLASFFGRTLVNINFDAVSLARLRRLDVKKNYAFAYEPHGPQVLGLCFTVAAPGTDSMPPALADNCVVVGHWIIVCVPFVAQFFALFGVVPSRPNRLFEMLLESGKSFAICPSGIQGKYASLLRTGQEPAQRKISVRRTRRSSTSERRGLGLFVYVARHKIALVPILSVDEDRAFRNLFGWIGCPHLVFPLGRQIFRPLCKHMVVRVGEPIDTATVDAADPEAIRLLADQYYEALAELALPDKIGFD